MNAVKIKIPFDCRACACNKVKVLYTRIRNLRACPIFAVLNDCVVHLKFPLSRHDVVGASAEIVEFAEEPKLPIVVRRVNQRRFRKDGLKAQFVANEPGDTAPRRDSRILEGSPADPDRREDLDFL